MKEVVSNLFIIALFGLVTSKPHEIPQELQVYSNLLNTTVERSPQTVAESLLISTNSTRSERHKIYVTSGDDIILTCNAKGFPAPTIKWIFGSTIPVTHQRRFVKEPNGDLKILQVDESYNGFYVCLASNEIGNVVLREMTLTVQVPTAVRAVLIKDPSDNYLEDSSISLTCNVSGNPAPEVFWRINGENVEESEHIQILQRKNKLMVHRATAGDSGRYSCHARNNFSSYSSDELQIDITPAVRAVIIKDPSNTYLEDSSISLTCNVSGNPAPEVFWTINGKNVVGGERISQIISENQHKLMVRRATAGDSGRYSCHARNNFISYSSDELQIDITTPVRAVISLEFSIEDSAIYLTCNVSGSPAPEVFWTINGKKIVEGERISQIISENQHKLIVRRATAEDAGTYKCHARNKFSEFTSYELGIKRERGIFMNKYCVDIPSMTRSDDCVNLPVSYCSEVFYRNVCCQMCTLSGWMKPGFFPFPRVYLRI